MKKKIAWILTLVLLLGLTACGGEPATTAYSGTMTELVNAIYEKQALNFSAMEPMALDTTDEFALQSYLGLTDGSEIADAVFSESMIGAQPYSLCAVRVKDGADAKALAQNMLDGVDPRKWVCVEADNVRVGVSGDVIVLAMVGSELSPTLADDLMTAFSQTVGGELEVILKK